MTNKTSEEQPLENKKQQSSKETTFEIDLVVLIKYIWNKRNNLLKAGVVGLVLGLVVAFSIPKTYTTSVKVALENSDKSSGTGGGLSQLAGIAGISIGSNTEGISSKIYPDIISSLPFMMDMMHIPVETKFDSTKTNLYEYIMFDQKKTWWSYIFRFPARIPNLVKSIFKEAKPVNKAIPTNDLFNLNWNQKGFASQLSTMIVLTYDAQNGYATIDVTMQDPLVSAIVADSVIVNLQRYMEIYRTQKAVDNYEQTKKLYDAAKVEYYNSQAAYANFLDGNRSIALESSKVTLTRLSNEMNLNYSVYSMLAQQLESSKIKVQENKPIFTIIDPAYVSLNESAPNKMLIVFVMVFLSVFVSIGTYFVKYIFESISENHKS